MKEVKEVRNGHALRCWDTALVRGRLASLCVGSRTVRGDDPDLVLCAAEEDEGMALTEYRAGRLPHGSRFLLS